MHGTNQMGQVNIDSFYRYIVVGRMWIELLLGYDLWVVGVMTGIVGIVVSTRVEKCRIVVQMGDFIWVLAHNTFVLVVEKWVVDMLGLCLGVSHSTQCVEIMGVAHIA